MLAHAAVAETTAAVITTNAEPRLFADQRIGVGATIRSILDQSSAMIFSRFAPYSASLIAPVARSVSSSCSRCEADGCCGVTAGPAGPGEKVPADAGAAWACSAAARRATAMTCWRTAG